MTRPNGHSDNGNVGFVPETDGTELVDGVPIPPPAPDAPPEFATRAKQRAKQHIQQNRFVIIGAGAIVTALLIFVAISMPHRGGPDKAKNRGLTSDGKSTLEPNGEGIEKSLFPITDSGRPVTREEHQGFLNERDLQRTVIRSASYASPTRQTNGTGTLGSIPPFGDQSGEAPPYQPASNAVTSDLGKAEREAMEKPSLMYVRKVLAGPTGLQTLNDAVPQLGLGLGTGTRLRGRLESAASTAVRAPVLAVVEYNYERDGEIIVPAGAKAVGHIRNATRSGYVDLQFDSLLMPDGASVPIEAAATDLDLRPLKGKVSGKNTGKNVLARSLSGIGQAGAMFLGQGSLSQPLSESDLMRERVSNNIGETGDEEVSRLAVNQQIVVTVSAGAPIYVILEQAPKSNQPAAPTSARNKVTSNSSDVDQLRQLLQLQQESNQSATNTQAAQ
ncbi:MAG: hypothetical protein WCC37_14155 [Candidatus Sulfotelmatobacter sp.]